MTPTILLYNVPAPLIRQISELGLELGYCAKKIARKRYLQPVGTHAGLDGFENTAEWYEGREFSEPVLVFAGFSDSLLSRFLETYRCKQLPEIAYRAILTDTNKDWNILELARELEQEHAALHPVSSGRGC